MRWRQADGRLGMQRSGQGKLENLTVIGIATYSKSDPPMSLIPARLFIPPQKNIPHVKGSSQEAWNPRPGLHLDALYPTTVIEAPLLSSEQPRDELHHLDDPSSSGPPPPAAAKVPCRKRLLTGHICRGFGALHVSDCGVCRAKHPGKPSKTFNRISHSRFPNLSVITHQFPSPSNTFS